MDVHHVGPRCRGPSWLGYVQRSNHKVILIAAFNSHNVAVVVAPKRRPHAAVALAAIVDLYDIGVNVERSGLNRCREGCRIGIPFERENTVYEALSMSEIANVSEIAAKQNGDEMCSVMEDWPAFFKIWMPLEHATDAFDGRGFVVRRYHFWLSI